MAVRCVKKGVCYPIADSTAFALAEKKALTSSQTAECTAVGRSP